MENNNKSTAGWWIGGIIIVLVIIVAVVLVRNPNTAPIQVETQTSQTPDTTEATTTTALDKPYTLAKVALHNTATDCWTVVSGKVYDISEFVPNHPGGEAIIQACGVDGTVLFTTRSNGTPHPSKAQQELQKYYIADLQQ